ncbi:MAG: SDR family NAD(P)-dependent oxidoreductase, partial [Clostridia bacterium]|nr:SDR family NAD(P)-dependent oxidoreductase [Clostridia bacterium]
NNTASLKGKTVVITGSTGGLGKEICKTLGFLGADLILVDRNFKRSSLHKEEIISRFPKIKVSLLTADMEDMDSVKSVCEKLKNIEFDYLILNAGAYSIPRRKTSLGYDNVFQINFVSQYYIARTLAPFLKSRDGKIITVGSIAHNYSVIDKNDIDFSCRKKSKLVYGNSKRYLMCAMYKLSKDTGVDISVVHPGITFTNITAHYPPLVFAVIKHPMKVIFMPARKACLSVVGGVFDSCEKYEWIGPRIFDVWGLPKKAILKTVSEEEFSFISSVCDTLF